MTTARIMAAALASIAAFLLGNSYAACLLSLPGSPAVNLTEAAKRLPSFLLGHGGKTKQDYIVERLENESMEVIPSPRMQRTLRDEC